MKLKTYLLSYSLITFSMLFIVSGCTKDQCTYTYSYFTPVYKTTAEVRANIKSNQPREIQRHGKLFVKGNYIFLNDIDKGIHVIDNTNPSSPKNVAFIDIPGNMDHAVKGNTLYADLYTDLVAIDITNPLNVSVKKIIENSFQHRYYTGFSGSVADSNKIITDWVKHETTVKIDCNSNFGIFPQCSNCMFDRAFALSGGTNNNISPFGMGGSMARFAIVNTTLFTVSDQKMTIFSIASPQNPTYTSAVSLGWGIETIYPFKNKLFIGSNTGMFIYDITDPSQPSKQGEFTHARTCDPVIADDDFAYVTLRSGDRCAGFTNQLDVVDIKNLMSPKLLKSYQMTNPHGLSKEDNTLFICDGKQGLKIYNSSDVNNIFLIKHIPNLETYDVIAYNKIAIVTASDGLYQFDYSDLNNIKLLSKVGWLK